MATFNIYVPSYNMANTTTTYKLLEYCTYVVRKSQEKDYRENGIKDIWAIDDELIDNGLKVHDYIIKNAKEDVIAMCDDDIINFMYRMDTNDPISDVETATSEIERLAQLTEDLRIGYLTTDSAPQPFGYDQPFSFSSGVSGALKIFNRKVFKSKIDFDTFYCFDVDLILQELAYNRVVLHPKYFLAHALIDKNSGGFSSTKTRSKVMSNVATMEVKWGKYFGYNFVRNIPKINVKR